MATCFCQIQVFGDAVKHHHPWHPFFAFCIHLSHHWVTRPVQWCETSDFFFSVRQRYCFDLISEFLTDLFFFHWMQHKTTKQNGSLKSFVVQCPLKVGEQNNDLYLLDNLQMAGYGWICHQLQEISWNSCSFHSSLAPILSRNCQSAHRNYWDCKAERTVWTKVSAMTMTVLIATSVSHWQLVAAWAFSSVQMVPAAETEFTAASLFRCETHYVKTQSKVVKCQKNVWRRRNTWCIAKSNQSNHCWWNFQNISNLGICPTLLRPLAVKVRHYSGGLQAPRLPGRDIAEGLQRAHHLYPLVSICNINGTWWEFWNLNQFDLSSFFCLNSSSSVFFKLNSPVWCHPPGSRAGEKAEPLHALGKDFRREATRPGKKSTKFGPSSRTQKNQGLTPSHALIHW